MSVPERTLRTNSVMQQHDIDWSPIAGAVVWMPAEHRRATLDQSTAMRMLGCTPLSFASLRALGLAADGTPHHPLFDANDIRNAALYSRSGRTEVERAMGAILSFLRGSDRELFGERRWSYEMVGMVPEDVSSMGTSEHAGTWESAACLLHPLTPEVFGGDLGALMTDVGVPMPAGDRVSVPLGVSLRGSMVTRGRPDTVVNPMIRAIADEFLASGVRWHYLSAGLKSDAQAAFALGVGNCDTLSAVLAGWLTEADFDARVYRGWIIGITEVPHSWIEVVDDDQRVKVIDPSLLLLGTHSSFGSPDFSQKAFGAVLSRIVPTRCQLGEPIGVIATGAPCDVRFSCRLGGRASTRV